MASCAILTTTANELMQPIHERMPVILDVSAEEQWLDPRSAPDSLGTLLVSFAAERMEAFVVNSYVSDPKHEGPRCIEPAVA